MTTGKQALAAALVNQAYKIGMTQEREEITSLVEFLLDKNIKNVLEIGTKLGGTFDLWCNLSRGFRVSIDLPGGAHGGWMMKDHPYMKNIYKKRNKYFIKKYKNIHMITGDSHSTETMDRIVNLPIKGQVDLLFIDGDHTYKGIELDYRAYSPFVTPGGFIVFHDINDTQHHRDIDVNVAKLWNELKGTKIEFNIHKHWAGIGVLQV